MISRASQLLIGLFVCVFAVSINANTLCFSPVKKKRGDISSERPWWKPFNYRIQVDDGPVIKPKTDSSTSYEFKSDRPLIKIRLGDEIVESFYVEKDMLSSGRNCAVMMTLFLVYVGWILGAKPIDEIGLHELKNTPPPEDARSFSINHGSAVYYRDDVPSKHPVKRNTILAIFFGLYGVFLALVFSSRRNAKRRGLSLRPDS